MDSALYTAAAAGTVALVGRDADHAAQAPPQDQDDAERHDDDIIIIFGRDVDGQQVNMTQAQVLDKAQVSRWRVLVLTERAFGSWHALAITSAVFCESIFKLQCKEFSSF